VSTNVFPIDSLDLRLEQRDWAFAARQQEKIGAHWRHIVDRNPALWNGRILMCSRCEVVNRQLIGRFFETDFASFVAWRDWGWPDRSIFNCFGSAAILSSDGAVMMGRMSAHTINGGKIYPPGGSLEPRDLRDNGAIDLLGSIAKELEEETGLLVDDSQPAGLIAVFDEQRVSIAQGLRFDLRAEEITKLAQSHWRNQRQPELDELIALRSPNRADLTMPAYAQEIARFFLER
jgi:8-oxo-dGTP pyrophosphatase MutT (NUDIX family)